MKIKYKIASFSIFTMLVVLSFTVLVQFGIGQIHNAEEDAHIANMFTADFSELQLIFEKSLMGPHDYIITGNADEKMAFESDFHKIIVKIDEMRQLLAGERSGHDFQFEMTADELELILARLYKDSHTLKSVINRIFEDDSDKAGKIAHMKTMDSLTREIQGFLSDESRKLAEFSVTKQAVLHNIWDRTTISLLVMGIISMLICILISFRLFRSIAVPVNQLVKTSRLVSMGDKNARVEVDTDDEFSELSHSFNNMLDQLVMSEDRTNAIFMAGGDSMRVIDREFNVVQSNNEMDKLLGMSLGQNVDNKCYNSLKGKYCHTVDCVLKQILGGKKHIHFEVDKETSEGKKIPVELIATPLKINGEICGVIESFRDISERRLNEKALIEAVEATKMANRAKSEFLANMSHEIRTPMNSIIGFLNVLLETSLNDDQMDFALTARDSGSALLSLINDILDFSKIEAGELDFEEIEFNPRSLACDVCEAMQPRLDSKPVEILCRLGDSLPSLLTGDPMRLRQVMTNLMGNAVKFTQDGEIELYIYNEEEKDGRIKLHVAVRDSGIGMPQDKLDTIFDSFKQVDGSISRKYGGTGLGLSICRKMSECLDGEVGVESVPGHGSTFHFSGWYKELKKMVTGYDTTSELSGNTVFVVDDNENNQEILARMIRRAGLNVSTFSNGNEALRALREYARENNPVDLVVVDLNMPGMNGYELGRQILDAGSGVPTLPIIAMSSLMERDMERYNNAGFNGFLSKPVREEKFFGMIMELSGGDDKVDIRDEPEENSKTATERFILEKGDREVCILLAEDNVVNQKLANHVLTKAGCIVDVACDGKIALEKFTAFPGKYDLILMDVQMPEMNGLEATRLIREKGYDSVPIVAMTANAMRGDRETCIESGMNDYVTKPFDKKILFKTIQKWVFCETGTNNRDTSDHEQKEVLAETGSKR